MNYLAGPFVAHNGGDELLPPLTWARVFTSWAFEPWVVAGLVVGAAVYGWGVVRLSRRGVRWNPWRTAFWMLGLVVVFVATSGSVGVYDTTLFSAHAVQHMMLQMFAPVPLALAAPITLALRALPRGGRQVLVAVLHSRYMRVVAHPLVAFALFVTAPFLLYYTPLYEATLRHEWLHNLSHLHFILVGCLLYFVLLALDLLPNPLPYAYRLIVVIFVGISHSGLGIPIMMGRKVFAEGFYRELGRTWGPSLIADQQTGGAILWALGDVTVMFYIPALLVQWMRSEDRHARRIDRNLDRIYGDARRITPWWESPAARGPQSGDAAAGAAEPNANTGDAQPSPRSGLLSSEVNMLQEPTVGAAKASITQDSLPDRPT